MKEIVPNRIRDCTVTAPGSKSHTHRILIASALSDGLCRIDNPLRSQDTLLTRDALIALGVSINDDGPRMFVGGNSGQLRSPDRPIHLGNSGTSMRLLTAIAALADGETILTGTDRMCERPLGDLIDALNELGVPARSINENGCPPVLIPGGRVKGGSIGIRCGISSQFLSALLLMAPCSEDGLDISVNQGPVSKPYIDMTVSVMEQMGVQVHREGYERFRVPGGQNYRSGDYEVEPDISNASYFWAAAAVTGGTVKVLGVGPDSRQGDIRLTDLFEQMGCVVSQEPDGLTVTGQLDSTGRPSLSAIDVDMGDMPDMVPTLAVVAAFAKGTTIIRNVAHLRAKESDRLAAVAAELNKMGIIARTTESELMVEGGEPHGAAINTYDDHRIAMSFAVAGLAVPGIVIKDEECVGKSFPGFWEVFEGAFQG